MRSPIVVTRPEMGTQPSRLRSRIKFKPQWFPFAIILVGVFFSLFLQLQISEGHFFSGDGSLKALLAQQWSAGEFRFDLNLPAAQWIKNLWQKGLYPFEEPFVYYTQNRHYITFPFTFPLVTAPFHALFGYRGFYVVPLLSTWAIWLCFYFACQRLKFNNTVTSIALAVLIFASPLTIYSAMYWEHNLAVALNFAALSILFIPGSQGLSKKGAILSGILLGLSVWFREEILGMVAFLFVVVYAASFFKIKKLEELTKRKDAFVFSTAIAIGIFFALNLLIYHHPLGIHSVQIVEKFSLMDRLKVGRENFSLMVSGLFYTFPMTLFAVLYLVGRWFDRKNLKFTLKTAIIYLLCIFFTVAVAAMVPEGAGGKQWGARFLLVLVPLITLVAMGQFNSIRKVANSEFKIIGKSIFVGLFIVGVYVNTFLGATWIDGNDQNINPAINFLRSHPNTVIATSHQYAAQALVYLNEKVFFLAKDNETIKTLGQGLIDQKINQFTYVCYPYRPTNLCKALGDKNNKKLAIKDQKLAMEFSSLGKFGIYPIYQVSIVKPSDRPQYNKSLQKG